MSAVAVKVTPGSDVCVRFHALFKECGDFGSFRFGAFDHNRVVALIDNPRSWPPFLEWDLLKKTQHRNVHQCRSSSLDWKVHQLIRVFPVKEVTPPAHYRFCEVSVRSP